MRVLVTGGAGYIGSHTCLRLLEAGHEVHVVDDLSNSSRVALERVATLTGCAVPLTVADVRDESVLDQVVTEFAPEAVIHFAGLKSVGESVAQPLRYWQVNVDSTMALLAVMERHDVRRLVFSSSATVYGTPGALPIDETAPVGVGISNPYGRTKFVIEQLLEDLALSDAPWEFVSLRYFNPVGAHASGRIGEDPRNIPNNLAPYVTQVLAGRLEELSVFGDDYGTADGTGVRDYVHVMDLADAHLAALENCAPGFDAVNVGTGRGTSVLELVAAFERVSGRPVPLRVTERRPGDVAACYADVSKARRLWGWTASHSIEEACADAWRWQQDNPQGFLS
ncbi:UDP-glucose 4-epimerase [Aeromicrobium flavum]|uniref:UDP-glucose 4-epimerase n=1 Tax=Aeromicrobium flavum TaxID=416568 RepID=A0A512HTA6_9ACTN|nr:UDP-glucose 4-epimerase GalE [Aeromicrobium flavum]GEO88688.1 UDP-glucose 4-epimerase [Aeromicrobium flavum]